MESPSSTLIILSNLFKSKIGGINSSDIPWILWWPVWVPVDNVGDEEGSSG